mmetsp:Transcript_50944/g.163016  ORF Transcript_50944/g.163016 Transcript_50944/m.163016 type:complete len:151 (-) Transcript_50944:832-1284(-)
MPHALQSATTDGADAGDAARSCSASPVPDADTSNLAASVLLDGATHSGVAASSGVSQDLEVAVDINSVAQRAGPSDAAGAVGEVATPGSLAEAVEEAPDVGWAAAVLLSVHTAGASGANATASGKAGSTEAKVVGSFAAPNDGAGPVGAL